MPHENVLCSWSLTGASREPRKPAPPRNRPNGRLESAGASEGSSKLGLCRSRSLHPSGVSAARRDTKVSRKVTKYLSHPRTGKGSRCWRKAHGPFLASSSFVTFRAIFVSRDFGITRRVGTWRRRRVKRSFEPGDGSALPIAEGDLPRSRVFVFRAKRREASQPPRPPPAQSPHRKNPCGGETPHERSARKPQPQEREV